MKNLLWLSVFILLAESAALLAQSAPTITVRKSDRPSIVLEGPGGRAGEVLLRDLEISGAVDVTSAERAGFIVRGSMSGGGLQGEVQDRSGGVVLKNSYGGGERRAAHRFADDIVETLTGQKGIAASTIAFVSTRTGNKEIYTADYDGANVQQLTEDRSISVAPSLSWDGSRLAYTGYKSGYADIYVVDLSSGSRQRVVKFPGTNTGPAFSPDGRKLAATVSKDGNPELYVVNASGGSGRRLTKTRGTESSPSWAPDGGEIVFCGDTGGSPQLYRIATRGGSPRLVRTGHGYCTEPNWSPDGKRVVFNIRSGGVFRVAVLDLDSGQTRVLTSGGNAEDPVWGPNSRHLLHVQGGNLYLLDAASGNSVKVLGGLGKISEPTWSRD